MPKFNDFMLNSGLLALIYVFLFVFGAIVGSFVNVWIARLSRDKSVLWPLSSRCGNCFQAIRWYDNLPLLSYWLLRGRCRTCGATFSVRYFVIELLIAAAMPALYYLEIIRNIHGIPRFNGAASTLQHSLFSPQSLQYHFFFLHHAVLFCFLVACASCDLQYRTIPLSLTMTGTIIGLVLSACFPWPWPNSLTTAMPHAPAEITEWWLLGPDQMQKAGLYAWPVWGPLPSWLAPGTWQLGLATGLAGALLGTFLLRAVKFLFEKGLRKEALGLGDADLMMMAGAFLGWQPVVVAFLVGCLVSLLLAVPNLILRGDNVLPFGPGLAIGTVLTWLSWSEIGPGLQLIFFRAEFMLFFAGGSAAVILIMSYLISLVQGSTRRT